MFFLYPSRSFWDGRVFVNRYSNNRGKLRLAGVASNKKNITRITILNSKSFKSRCILFITTRSFWKGRGMGEGETCYNKFPLPPHYYLEIKNQTGLFAVTSLPKNRIADVNWPALAPAVGPMFSGSTGMSLQGNASSTRILLVARFGQVNAVNFGNEEDFLRLLGNAYAAFYRIGQRRTAWNGHNCANALY